MPHRTVKHFTCPSGHNGTEFEGAHIQSDAKDLALKGLRGMKFVRNDCSGNSVYQCETCGATMSPIPAS